MTTRHPGDTHSGDTHSGDTEVTSRVTAQSPPLPYNKKASVRRCRRAIVDMCASSAGARSRTRLTARQSNGYIGGLTVRCWKDETGMNLRLRNARTTTPPTTTPATTTRARRCALLRRSLAIGATVACGAAVTTACSSGSAHPGVAQLTTSASTSAASGSPGSASTKGPASPLAHAECMRSHGVPDFPDPGPIHIDVSAHPDLDPSSPAFVAAQKACLSLQPGGTTGVTVSPQLQAAALAYSACMRSHGFPKFADPVFDSSGEHVSINGINTDSAQFQNADKLCQSSTGLAALGNGTPTGGAP